MFTAADVACTVTVSVSNFNILLILLPAYKMNVVFDVPHLDFFVFLDDSKFVLIKIRTFGIQKRSKTGIQISIKYNMQL